jgi:MraZ protein
VDHVSNALIWTMFIGEHRHSIDEKGRLQVPAKWRGQLAEGAVVTKGFDGSLKLYPVALWQEKAAELTTLPQSQPASRAFVRQTLAGAVDLEPDKLGRFVIPPFLRQFASLGKDTVLAGLADHIEIWDVKAWDEYQQSIDPSSPEYVETLTNIGI